MIARDQTHAPVTRIHLEWIRAMQTTCCSKLESLLMLMTSMQTMLQSMLHRPRPNNTTAIALAVCRGVAPADAAANDHGANGGIEIDAEAGAEDAKMEM